MYVFGEANLHTNEGCTSSTEGTNDSDGTNSSQGTLGIYRSSKSSGILGLHLLRYSPNDTSMIVL